MTTAPSNTNNPEFMTIRPEAPPVEAEPAAVPVPVPLVPLGVLGLAPNPETEDCDEVVCDGVKDDARTEVREGLTVGVGLAV
jgi:hypothetical protein